MRRHSTTHWRWRGADSAGHVEELLRLFREVSAQTGSDTDGMWAVLAHLRAQRRRCHLTEFDIQAGAIVAATCAAMGVTLDDLVGRSPARPLVQARWVAMRALRDKGYSLPLIGAQLRRTHPTVIWGLARIGQYAGLVEIAERVRVSPRVQGAV